MKAEDVFKEITCRECGSILFPKAWGVNPSFETLWFECPRGCSVAKVDAPYLYNIIPSSSLERIRMWLDPTLPYSKSCHCGGMVGSNSSLRDDIPSLGYVCSCGDSLRELFIRRYGYITGGRLYNPRIPQLHIIGDKFVVLPQTLTFVTGVTDLNQCVPLIQNVVM